MGDKKPIVLFVCVHNTARSQMAEGLLRHYGKGIVDVRSCGTKAADEIHPLAAVVMDEIDVNIRDFAPKIDKKIDVSVDYIISLCEADAAACKVVKQEGAVCVSWQLADPAKVDHSEAEQREAFIQTRDSLKARVKHFVSLIETQGWLEEKAKVRTEDLLEVHDKQLTIGLVESVAKQPVTHQSDLDDPTKPIDVTKIPPIDLLRRLTVRSWGVIIAGLTTIFLAGWAAYKYFVSATVE